MADDNKIIAEILVEGVDKFKADLKGAQGSVEQLNAEVAQTGDVSKQAMTEAAQSTASYRTQLKNMTSELVGLNLQLAEMKDAGKAGSKEFSDLEKRIDSLRKKAGELKDAMADAGEQIKATGSDTAGLDKAIRVVGSASAAFQVFEGAAVLAGKGNEDLQKALVKLNAVMAITQGLQQIQNELVRDDSVFKGVATKATAAYNLVIGQSTGALKAFRIALAATGIGLAIVGIVALVENWDKLKTAIFGATMNLEDFNKQIETRNRLRKEQADADDLELLRLKEKGQSELVIAKAQLENAQIRKKQSDDEVKRLEQLYKQEEDINYQRTINILGFTFTYSSNQEQINKLNDEYIKEKENNTNLEKSLISAQIAFNSALAASQQKTTNAVLQNLEKERKAREDYYNEISAQNKAIQDEISGFSVGEVFGKNETRSAIFYQNEISRLTKIRDSVELGSEQYFILDKQIQNLTKSYQDLQKTDQSFIGGLNIDKAISDIDAGFSGQSREARLEEMFQKAQTYYTEIQAVISQTTSLISNATQVRAQNEIAALEQKRQRGLISEKQYEREVAKIKNEAARKQRAADIANGIALIPQAVLQAYIGGLKISPIAAGIFAGIAGAFAAAQVALIASAPLPKFRDGGSVAKRLGLIKGKSHEAGGVPIEVEGDEFVMSKKAVKHYGVDFMDKVNNMKLSPVVTMSPKLEQMKQTDYKLYEHLATLGGYMKQDYRTNERALNVLAEINQGVRAGRKRYV